MKKLLAGTSVAVFLICGLQARDLNGQYAGSPLKPWFDGLKNGNLVPCCSDADGRSLADGDWRSAGDHYQVNIEGEWVDVPDEAVIKTPNLAGRTMVWPYWINGKPFVRCFLRGAEI